MSDFDQVLRLAACGWRLFPVKPRGKQPLVSDWPHQATTEEDHLRTWSQQFPECNWAVATGPESGVFVLDVDGEPGLISLRELDRQGRKLSPTLVSHTGRPGGGHIWLLYPSNGTTIRNSAGKLATGLDVRGDGGYVVVPPSTHANGTEYSFVDEDSEIAAAPQWLLEKLRQPPTTVEPDGAPPKSDAIPQGQRNDTLMRLAGTMRNKGMTPAAIEAALLAENKQRCVPPLGEREVRAIVESASRYEAAPAKRGVDLPVEHAAREWPAPLAPEAFYGIAGEFVHLIGPETEADDASLLFSFLILAGSIIGRGPYYQVGGTKHYVNLFATVVGETSKSRKGVSWGEVLRLAHLVDADWRRERVVGGLTSGEGLIHAVRDQQGKDEGVTDKRLMVAEGELSQALQAAGREGCTLSAVIRLSWDGVPLRVLAKQAKACCLEPHISILGHITVGELQRQLTTNDMGNGFANRFLWLCAARTKFLPFGGKVNIFDLDRLAERITEAITFARGVERVEFVGEAREQWADGYRALSEGQPGLFGSVIGRAEAQAVRLATLYALLDKSEGIKVPHLRAALACWRYCHDSAAYIFGDSLGDPTADEILAVLRTSVEGMTRNDIYEYFSRNKSSAETSRALAVLQAHGLARVEQVKTAGRPAQVWKAVREGDVINAINVESPPLSR